MAGLNIIDLRVRQLIEARFPRARRYQDLEDMSGIAASTWKTYLTRGGRPSADMLVALGQRWPELSEWLLTGTVKAAAQTIPLPTLMLDGAQ